MSRRGFMKAGAGATGLLLPPGLRRALAQAQTPLPGSAIPQFVDPLPTLSVAGGPIETVVAGAGEIELRMREFQANVMPTGFVPVTGPYTGTWVWGYVVGPTAPAWRAVT